MTDDVKREELPAHSSALPPTTLIICSRNRAEMLSATLTSILSGNEVPSEIIVIDQSTASDPALAARTDPRCEIRYVWTTVVGLSRAINTAVAMARTEILAFTHDDVTVTADWFGNLVRALLAADRRTVVTGLVAPSEPETTGGFQSTLKADPTPAVYAGKLDRDVLYALNMVMWRQVFEEIGAFDVRLGPGTSFPGAEDADFGYRLLQAGYRIVYAPQAALYHRLWRPATDFVPLRWAYGVARGALYAKYASRGDRHMLRRGARDVTRHLVAAIAELRQDRRFACGAAALGVGVLVGAARWFLTLQPRRSPV